MKWKSLSHVRLFVTPRTVQSMEFSRPEYWSGYLSLLQGIVPTQGSNLGLLHCKRILYQLSHQGSPRILAWVAYPFSTVSSWPQESNQDLLHCRPILYQLATREARNIRFIYLLAALGLHCSAGFSPDAVCGLLVVASLVAEHAL